LKLSGDGAEMMSSGSVFQSLAVSTKYEALWAEVPSVGYEKLFGVWAPRRWAGLPYSNYLTGIHAVSL